ncbi:MAG: hypothetical protein RR359_01395, partial [Bacilli bacterium]
MKKLNNKGFAISTILYGTLMLASLTLFLIISTIASSKTASNNFVKHVEEELNISIVCKNNTLSERIICGLGANGTVYEPVAGGTKYI